MDNDKRLGDAGYINFKLPRTNNRGDGMWINAFRELEIADAMIIDWYICEFCTLEWTDSIWYSICYFWELRIFILYVYEEAVWIWLHHWKWHYMKVFSFSLSVFLWNLASNYRCFRIFVTVIVQKRAISWYLFQSGGCNWNFVGKYVL